VRSDDGRFAAANFDRLLYRGHSVVGQTLHLLLVVDERAEAANYLTGGHRVLDHLHRAFDAEAKTVFIRE
jgi:hypothetical protein